MSELLANYLGGRWLAGTGAGTPLYDPVLGTELVRVDATGLDLAAALRFARASGGKALRALTYRERAGLLARVVDVLKANRDDYYAIACANSGTVRADSAIDIDGAIYTLGTYARLGAALPDAHALIDGEDVSLAKDGSFQVRHLMVPTRGVAVFINAFNFPAWGLWEKAAPALLSGVPVVVKPATATAWLAQRMVHDIVAANVLPEGALSIVCGSGRALLDALEPGDVLSFTGSAETAATIRSHPAVCERSVRVNIEADSLNAALLLPGEPVTSEAGESLVREVVRELTVKSGQKCTAIRRILVPESHFDAVAAAISSRLAAVTVGNPRNGRVQMGALVNRSQWLTVREGLDRLKTQTEVLHDGATQPLVDADPAVACCLGPTLLGARAADAADLVHALEVFGPVATLMPYRDLDHAHRLIRRGQGSLVVSLYGSDDRSLAHSALELADLHGRVHVVSPAAAASQTGHGNVMPQSLHGGPGRAGGGEELGGLRALAFHHRRTAIQAHGAVLSALPL
jgi:3,4-dehydroadipyl-CoA semialdehyde dehydrogenase